MQWQSKAFHTFHYPGRDSKLLISDVASTPYHGLPFSSVCFTDLYIQCIQEVDDLEDAQEMCDDVMVVMPEDATLEDLKAILTAHYTKRATLD